LTDSTPDPAIDGLRHAVEAAPNDDELRRILGRRLLATGRYDEAIDVLRVLVRRSPKDIDARVDLASAYLASDRAGAASLVVEEAVVVAPDRADLRYLQARCLTAAGQGVEAAEAYRAAYALDPQHADVTLASSIGAQTAETSTLRPGDEAFDPEPELPEGMTRPTTRFADVGGMAGLKAEIKLRIIDPFSHPDLFEAYGQAAGGGVLLYGPPGCGKTFLARATAGELGAAFVNVGIADVLDMWLGQSERNLHDLFRTARQHRPCVLFFDEADALAADRSKFRGSAGRTVINQFLAELDGVDASNDGLLVLAATNAPWHLDPAFRRPGRFDQVVFVPPPDVAARTEILRLMVDPRPHRQIDYDGLARRTEGFSGADLRGVVDRAVQRRLRQAVKSGIPEPITNDDLSDEIKATIPTTREWFAQVKNYVKYANEAGLYDAVRPYLI
jgi:transitional endoplasmic reticulum ATPase